MYNSLMKMPSKYPNPYNLGFHISPDITIEFINKKNDKCTTETTESSVIENDEEDADSYFNPLIFCAITMDEDADTDENTRSKNDDFHEPPPKIERRSITIKPQSNENSSFVCNSTVNPSTTTASKPKKRFSCHVCSKTFGWTTDLKRHLLIHTGERPFKCTMCFATFTRNFLLQKHKTKIHQCLSPSEVSQLDNNVAKNVMEIKMKMMELEKEKVGDKDDKDEEASKCEC